MIVAPGNAQALGDRDEQQDAFGFTDLADSALVAHGGVLAALADGMGGMALGRQAAQRAIRTLLDTYAAKAPATPIPEALLGALHQANAAVLSLTREAHLTEGEVGTTLCAAVIHADALYWVAVGDSRIYLWRDGELTQLNEEHTLAWELLRQVASGTLEREQALVHPDRDILTSYLGLAGPPEIDRGLRPFALHPGDRLLLCSDGVYRPLPEADIAAALGQGSAQAAAERLIEQALARKWPQQDNLTAVILAGEPVPAAATPPPPRPPRRPWLLGLFGLLGLLGAVALYQYPDVPRAVWERLAGSNQPAGEPQAEQPAPAKPSPGPGGGGSP